MTLDQLKALQAIVEGGSLREAAQKLHRTQPTISVAIKNLENELGLRIFDRDQYRNTLTDQGKRLYEKAKLVLGQAESFEMLAKQLSIGEETEVGIAFDSGVPVHLILNIIKQCKVEFPRTRLEIYSENVFGAFDRIEEGKASIIVQPWNKNVENLESIKFMDLSFICVTAAHLNLTGEHEVIAKDVMRNYSQVIICDTSRRPSKEKYAVLEGGDQWKVNDYQTKKEIIMQGMGWGFMPEHLIKNEIKQGLLVPVKIEGMPESGDLEFRVARLRDEHPGPVARRLWRLFLESSADEV